MHLKRYRRATIHEALQAVRDDLGPDAFVLSTRTVSSGGVLGWFARREIEIAAATERPPVSEFRHPVATPTAADAIVARLAASGIDDTLAREVADAVPCTRRRAATPEAIRTALAERLADTAPADSAFAPVEVFVGPPGAGKTTTIAKIAAQERARRGHKLSLLAADGFRVGAIEQLRMFAEIIGAPFLVARSPEELADTLERGRRPLLLDTAGRSPNDSASREMFQVLSRRRDVRTHLVLPGGSTTSEARRVIERFQDAKPSRIVLTKCDETDSIAPLLSIAREVGLPVSYLGTGQSVPEDLERATPSLLASWLLGDRASAGAFA